MDVLQRIDELRRERGWSVNNLAMEAMLTQSTLNNLYSRRAEPKLSTLRALCGAFGITLAEFFSPETDGENGEETEDEALIRKVRALSPARKRALMTLLEEEPRAEKA